MAWPQRLAAALLLLWGPAGEAPYAELPAELSASAAFALHDGHRMPVLGLGVFLAAAGGEECYNSVKYALDAGYRLVDTAQAYGNEAEVGKAIRDSGIPREEIFVTSKLMDNFHGFEEALQAGRRSNDKLGLGYMDLFLVHSPNMGRLVETWDALLELQREGMVRSIGVSNYNIAHIEALSSHGRPLPVVNQIEMHPLVYKARSPLLDYCKQQRILVQAYGSIFWGQKDKLNDGTVAEVAASHGKTPAQVLLRWALQMGFQIIPKSVRQHRVVENAQLFDFMLSLEEMAKLSSMEGQNDTSSALGYWSPLETPVDLGRTDLVPQHIRTDL